MKILGKLQNQDDMELTLSITMRLKEWKELQEVVPQTHPHWKLSSAITMAVLKAGTTVNEEIESN